MTKAGQAGDDASAAQLAILGLLFGGAFVLFGLLHHLLQPSVVANPGLAAFSPSPGTRLVPLPRQSDAPALAELPAEPASPLTAFALTAVAEAKPDAKRHVRRRARASTTDSRSGDSLFYDPLRSKSAQQWNSGYFDWGAGNRRFAR